MLKFYIIWKSYITWTRFASKSASNSDKMFKTNYLRSHFLDRTYLLCFPTKEILFNNVHFPTESFITKMCVFRNFGTRVQFELNLLYNFKSFTVEKIRNYSSEDPLCKHFPNYEWIFVSLRSTYFHFWHSRLSWATDPR